MKVARWKTPAAFFPWPHVQHYIDRIDSVVYSAAIECAQEQYLELARPCPQCGRSPQDLFWFCVTSPEDDWDQGIGKVGFLTLCKACRLQVNFLVDDQLTELDAENWRDGRFLS